MSAAGIVGVFVCGFVLGVFAPGSRRSIQRRLASIDFDLQAQFIKGDQLMTVAGEINDKLDRVQAALTNVAADVRGLKAAAGMTQEEADALNARLETIATNAEALAAETPDAPAGGTDQPTGDAGTTEEPQS